MICLILLLYIITVPTMATNHWSSRLLKSIYLIICFQYLSAESSQINKESDIKILLSVRDNLEPRTLPSIVSTHEHEH